MSRLLSSTRTYAVTSWLASVIVLSVVVTGLLGATLGSPCTSPSGKSVSVQIKHPDGSELKVADVPWIDNCTVTLAMTNAKHIDPRLTFDTSYFCPYGAFVTSIDGFQESGDHYWALYINGTFAKAGMDTQLLNANDAVTWQVESVSSPPADSHSTHQAVMAKHRIDRRVDALIRKSSTK